MKINKKLSRLSLGVLAGLGLSISYQGFAQEENEATAEEPVKERIQVVGSRIRTDAFANETPIDIISVTDAEEEGLKTLGELLRTSTAAAGSNQLTAALTVGFVTNGGTGAESVSLRGLGANRTLILLNGRRAGPAGTRGAVSAFDLNSIPLSMVERVEILKDGASSLYGSDAVAGVINIITRKGDDKSVNVDISQPMDSGGEDRRINVSYGEEFAEGSFRITADYRKVNMLRRGDRDYLACEEDLVFGADGSQIDVLDPRTGQPHCNGRGFGIWAAGALSNFYGGSLQMAFDYDGFFAANGFESINEGGSGATTPEGWYPVSFRNNPDSEGWWDLDHPFLRRTTLVPETTNASIYATGEYNLTDNIVGYSEFVHSNRNTKTDANRQFWTADIGFVPMSAIDGFSGDGFVLPVNLTDHFSSEIDVDYTRFVLGATGDIGFWTWDASYQHSHNSGTYINDIILRDSWEMAQVAFRDGVSCAGMTTEFSNKQCVDVRIGNPDLIFGNPSDAERDFLFGVDTGNTTYKQQTFEAYITGDLYSLPAGEIGTAIGFQIQRDEINDKPGEQTLLGNSWGLTGAGQTAGSQITRAVFAEFRVPLIEEMTGFNRVDLTASGRWTDVNTFGSDTTFKLGLNWEIVEGLNIRASRGTSFRAPALYELYLADQTGFGGQLAVDPCLDYVAEFNAGNLSDRIFNNCQADGVPASWTGLNSSSALLVTSGGAGRLSAETSVAETAGFVFISEDDRLAFSMDYYDIVINGEVANIGGGNITNGCYTSIDFANEPLCDLFTRRDGSVVEGDFGIDQINGGYVNVASQATRGFDYNLTLQDDFDFGTLRLSIEHTMQIERTFQLFADSTYNNNIGENTRPKHNGNVRLTWSNDDYRVVWTAQYFDSTNDYEYYANGNETTYQGEPATFLDETPWTTYHTVSLGSSYEDFDFTVGVANVFDKKPPLISGRGDEVGNAARYSRFDFTGRRVFANIRYNF